MNYQQLKKHLKNDVSSFEHIKMAVLGDVATQLLSDAIKAYGALEKLNIDIFEADYNQIDSQLMDERSETYKFDAKVILLYMSVEKAYDKYCETNVLARESFAVHYMEKIKRYWSFINNYSKSTILQFNFAEYNDYVFGNFGNKVEGSFIFQIRKLNVMLMEEAVKEKNVFVTDFLSLQNYFGRNALYDEKMYYTAKMAISFQLLPEVAKQVINIVKALAGKIKKCIVLDLDNTLWGGVIGDDGLANIHIGELGTGKAFTAFQQWLRQLKEKGIVLTVCSKNNEDIAKEPFEKHPEMILTLEDISIFVANWQDKASNIKYIQETLNLGMDSLVFLDDNPFERNLVKSIIPDITVPELPEDPALYTSFLQSLNLFEMASYSEEDANRTKQYKQEISRTALQNTFSSIDDYLISLNMLASIKAFDTFSIPRVAQLTQRSNQFNLRTIRYTDADIEEISNNPKYIAFCVSLKDSIGDHGIISVIVMENVDEDTLFINTWLMSCRVLKRGVEEFIVNTMLKKATDAGFKKVIGEYIKTSKNAMVEHIYENMGFKSFGADRYIAEVDTFIENKTYIKENI